VTSLTVRQEGKRASVLVLSAMVATTAAACTSLLLLALLGLGRHTVAIGPRPVEGFAFLLTAVCFSIGLGDTLFFLSLQRIGVARAMPISMSQPLLTTLLAVLFLGERVTIGLGLGLVLIPVGLYLVTLPARGRVVVPEADAPSLRIGVAMAFGAAASWALATVFMRPGLEQVDAVTGSAVRTAAGAALVWLIAWRGARLAPGAPLGRPRLAMGLLAGLFASASTVLFSLAVQHAGAARAGTLASTSPLWAVPLSALLLGEQVSRRMLLGTALAVSGVALVVGL
jgi:drug/metabolite transporter (DMT)-like permease